MYNIFLVTRHEILNTLKKRSFWFLTIVFPGMIVLINVVMQLTTRSAFEDSPTVIPQESAAGLAIGYVDRARVISEMPPGVPPGMLRQLENEAEALELLQNGEIDYYYLIPSDFVESGQILQIDDEINPLKSIQDPLLQYILHYNLTGDAVLAERLLRPSVLTAVSIAPETPDESGEAGFIVSFATMFIFFLAITTSSGFLLQSVTREKENRTVEILLLSLNPRQLMLGKLLGSSVIAMIQLGVWLGAGLLALYRAQMVLPLMSAFRLPPGFVVWGLLYFAFGYLTYASIMSTIGALSPSMREGSQFTFFAILPLLLPLWLSNTFIFSPNGPLSVFLSLFPLTSPTSMMTRMISTSVPTWHIGVGLVMLALTTYLFVALSARFFRADTLLSGTPINWYRIGRNLKQLMNKDLI